MNLWMTKTLKCDIFYICILRIIFRDFNTFYIILLLQIISWWASCETCQMNDIFCSIMMKQSFSNCASSFSSIIQRHWNTRASHFQNKHWKLFLKIRIFVRSDLIRNDLVRSGIHCNTNLWSGKDFFFFFFHRWRRSLSHTTAGCSSSPKG